MVETIGAKGHERQWRGLLGAVVKSQLLTDMDHQVHP